MHMYGANPLDGTSYEPGRALVRCTRCAKAVAEWAAADHRREFESRVVERYTGGEHVQAADCQLRSSGRRSAQSLRTVLSTAICVIHPF
jgi:hypothetical protein